MATESSGRSDRILLLLLAVSLVVNVAAVWWFVSGRVVSASARGRPDVAVGARLDPIVGVSPDGQAATVSYAQSDDQRPVVLYVFSPTCKWCERNNASIAALSQSAGARFRFVGVSLPANGVSEKTQSYQFPVVLTKGGPFRSTPQTLVVAADGRVLQSWLGAYIGTNKAEVEAYFATRLPDLKPATAGGAND